MDDYPNSSETFEAYSVEPPQERTEAEQKENAKVTSSVGVIKDVLVWLEEKTKAYESIQSLTVDKQTDPNHLMAQVMAAQRMHTELTVLADTFRLKYKQHLKEDADEA